MPKNYDDITLRLQLMARDKTQDLEKYRPSAKPFRSSNFPFYWITRVANRYTHNMELQLKKLGITITSWRTLAVLKELGPQSISDIAHHAASRLPTTTRTVYKLRDQAMVDIAQQEDDARVTIVSITPKGLETVQSISETTRPLFDNIYDDLSDGQLHLLNEILEKLFDNMPPTAG
ncbi:MarR family transcriptional regulator [Halioxenophilus aromaticivorans]|uniref:MarR family transcriptional regulator n=1 Tax=Halioxenophilus aromaticivorans TaxID=1306992 RepID=A0AAV3U559_9ALTE